MFDFLKKKVPPHKILLCVALPYEKEVFEQCVQVRKSDFLGKLGLFPLSLEEAWQKYKDIAIDIESCIKELKSRNVDVIPLYDVNGLSCDAFGYEVVMILAHRVEDSDSIELLNGPVRVSVLASSFPRLENCTIDVSSCFSASFQRQLKFYCPTCRILTVNAKTSLRLRLLLYQETVKRLAHYYSKGYIDTLRNVCMDIMKLQKGDASDQDPIYLGGDADSLQSSVYAPKEVPPGDSFMVQLFIHKLKDSSTVQIKASAVDKTSDFRNSKGLSFTLNCGDTIKVRLESVFDKKNEFEIDESDKVIEWNDEPVSLEYLVSVIETCTSKAFRGRLRICVNSLQVGDILFNVFVTDCSKAKSKEENAIFVFSPHDKEQEANNALRLVKAKLEEQISNFERCLANPKESQQPAYTSQELEISRHCLELIEKGGHSSSPIKVVFISSTSDLTEYREIVRRAIEKNNMFPDMYENWSQGNIYPRDKCCERVLNSDIFICILGANYGCIDPIWGMSMTEIEYRVAQLSGKPILVYVDKHYQSKMESLRNKQLNQRQLSLINEIKETRWVQFFDSPTSLDLYSRIELSEITKNFA